MSDVIGVIGLVVTVLGFGGTIWQLVRTANATTATKQAVEDANKRMLLNHLLVLIPQLKTLEADLDASIAADDKFTAIRTLVNFSHAANQIAALLEGSSGDAPTDADLITELREAAKSSTSAKAALVSAPTRSLTNALKTVSAQISEVSSRCAGLSTRYQSKVA